MKTVLITGACGGLGNKTALYFAEKGWQVIATVYSLDLIEDLNVHPNIKFYTLIKILNIFLNFSDLHLLVKKFLLILHPQKVS